MEKWLGLDVPCVISIWDTPKPLVKSIILEEQDKEKQPLLSDYAQNTIEEIQEFMAWEEKLLKENMGQPKKNY